MTGDDMYSTSVKRTIKKNKTTPVVRGLFYAFVSLGYLHSKITPRGSEVHIMLIIIVGK